jgi:hypothetical protein
VATLDDLPVFRPRIGGGRKPTSRSGAASFRNAQLASLRARRGRHYTPAELTRIDRLVAQKRLALFHCGCGMRYAQVTPEGREAFHLDALSSLAPAG